MLEEIVRDLLMVFHIFILLSLLWLQESMIRNNILRIRNRPHMLSIHLYQDQFMRKEGRLFIEKLPYWYIQEQCLMFFQILLCSLFFMILLSRISFYEDVEWPSHQNVVRHRSWLIHHMLPHHHCFYHIWRRF